MSDVEEIELSIAQAQDKVEMGNALDRLGRNKDFQKIILEGYFRDHAIGLVKLKATPAMARPEMQANILKSIDSIGDLDQYFAAIQTQADMAREAVDQGEEALEEIALGGDV